MIRMEQMLNSWWFNLIMVCGIIAMPTWLIITLAIVFMGIKISNVLFDKYNK